MDNQAHPLALKSDEVTKEFNMSKFLGQVALGIAVSISVKYLVSKIEIFIGQRKKG